LGHGRGGWRSQAVKQGIDGKDKETVRKSKKHAEADAQHEAEPVRLKVGNSKRPDFSEFLHNPFLAGGVLSCDAEALGSPKMRRK